MTRVNRSPATHQVVQVMPARRVWRWEVTPEQRLIQFSGTEQECERAHQALRDVHSTHTYVIEPIEPPSTP